MTRRALVLAVAFVVTIAGCNLLRRSTVDSGGQEEGLAHRASPVFVSVVPSYRLVLDSTAAGLPSRLLVLRTRVEAATDDPVELGWQDFRFRLADGEPGRIFDPARASVLVRRTLLAEAMPIDGGPLPGAVPGHLQLVFKDDVLTHLIGRGTVRPGEPLQGYLVVDTGHAVPSLEGAVLEATDGSDPPAVRDAYVFTPPAPSGSDGSGVQ